MGEILPTVLLIGRSETGKTYICHSLLSHKTEKISTTLKCTEYIINPDSGKKFRILDCPGFNGKLEFDKVIEEIHRYLPRYSKVNLVIYCQTLTDRVKNEIFTDLIDWINIMGNDVCKNTVHMVTLSKFKLNDNVQNEMIEKMKREYPEMLEEHGLERNTPLLFFDEKNFENSFIARIMPLLEQPSFLVPFILEDLLNIPTDKILSPELTYFWTKKAESRSITSQEKTKILRIVRRDPKKEENMIKRLEIYSQNTFKDNLNTFKNDLFSIMEEQKKGNFYYLEGSCKKDLAFALSNRFHSKMRNSIKEIISVYGDYTSDLFEEDDINIDFKIESPYQNDFRRTAMIVILDLLIIYEFGVPSLLAGIFLTLTLFLLILWWKDNTTEQLTEDFYNLNEKKIYNFIKDLCRRLKFSIIYH